LEAANLIDRLDRLARAGEQVRPLNPAQWEALRYLGRANRFSRTPAALAEYVASTRGTISRTLASLESKGYLSRAHSRRDGRSVEFVPTAKGIAALKRDPIFALARQIDRATKSDPASLVEGLRATLQMAIAQNGGRAFGACHTCRHFQAHVHPQGRSPHHCGLLNEPLSENDAAAICIEQEPATTLVSLV
jgi:DNA-binding MarR family transcriptional regulator